MSLLGKAQRYLAGRAERQDVGGAPAAYQLLYDFHAGRSDWQAAAAAQLALARRLHAESRDRRAALDGVAAALGARPGRMGLGLRVHNFPPAVVLEKSGRVAYGEGEALAEAL